MCSVVDLEGGDVENPQVCDGGLEQGEAMHARVLASARRRGKEREKTGQEAEKSILEALFKLVRDGRVRPIGYSHSCRPLCHAAFSRVYIAVHPQPESSLDSYAVPSRRSANVVGGGNLLSPTGGPSG